ncbi:MAG: 30S ribosomal protein S14 [Gammaproteobacteria bacterium RIFCSPHIGHO2_02_FULL_42_13]|nr:MAG: 30S ribosomal protein S14 [Gammaproteobacteria bacterium RIFCSPHIGHO2_02_FULL_42_13]OGT68461.1 MAG: 30S ribosomal protein S14 [Gammaproteobacteria bacterium RIFCSPLOWO2_02_FULL_42_9]HLB57195.1 30S ribosomal protein S14 [Gammaproteobacteria bacterium]
MAKTSVCERNKKRQCLESRYRVRRDELKKVAREAYAKGDIPWDVYARLQKMPRDAHRTRIRNRCRLCGRPRGVYRRFGMCRMCLRKYAMLGYIPGLVKSSW